MSLDLILMLVCFALTHLLLVWFLFRRKAQTPLLLRAEGLPLLVVLAGVYVWMAISAGHLWGQERFQGADPAAAQVEVVGAQFQWYFRYPGPDAFFGAVDPKKVNAAIGNPLGLDHSDPYAADDIVSSELVLPAGREVDIRLRSLDVIHGFFIPGMRLKQNAVPGQELHIHFTPQVEGLYPILCTQVCGLGHGRMNAQLRVLSQSSYEAWLQKHSTR